MKWPPYIGAAADTLGGSRRRVPPTHWLREGDGAGVATAGAARTADARHGSAARAALAGAWVPPSLPAPSERRRGDSPAGRPPLRELSYCYRPGGPPPRHPAGAVPCTQDAQGVTDLQAPYVFPELSCEEVLRPVPHHASPPTSTAPEHHLSYSSSTPKAASATTGSWWSHTVLHVSDPLLKPFVPTLS